MLFDFRSGSVFLRRCFAITMAIAACTATALATERISSDTGGRIGSYLTKYTALRKTGERVVIDGTCASSCTLVVDMIPRNRICVTSRSIGIPCRLEPEPLWSADQHAGHTLSAGALSSRCPTLDRSARRTAFTDDIFERPGIGGNVYRLPLSAVAMAEQFRFVKPCLPVSLEFTGPYTRR
jgi:hypothetical protein